MPCPARGTGAFPNGFGASDGLAGWYSKNIAGGATTDAMAEGLATAATPVMRKPMMALPVIGSPLHDWSMMTATSAATTTAPAIVRVRSRPNTCRISVTFNQLLRGHVVTIRRTIRR